VSVAPGTDGAVDRTVRIPFNRPSLQGREIEYIRAAVERGHTSAEGPFSARAASLLRDELAAHDVLLTTSCTAALEMSALLLGVGAGDTVVVPSFGFVTTALAFARAGARILFCDIEERTLGLDPERLAEVMDDSVRAVVPIHYAGVGCDIEGIQRVLEGWPRAELVEDNAHGLYGRYRGSPLGTFGRLSTLSFHETKNFICGEGGALVVNREDDIRRAHVVYHKGTNRREFLLGEVDKYTWQDTGSSFGLADVLAAYLCAQLEEREKVLTKRRAAFDRYRSMLEPDAERLGFALPTIPQDREQAYHMFYALLPDGETRNRVLAGMRDRGVLATFHFVPLHDSPGGRRFAARDLPCPVSELISGRLLRLPFYTDLAASEAEEVVDAFLAALRSAKAGRYALRVPANGA
jgi:dTDP-4-amino-4,6-dideoxygalactose transaminase